MRFSQIAFTAVLVALGFGGGIAADRYLLAERQATPGAASGRETGVEEAHGHREPSYACPMHPEVISRKPESCPICGMDLVAVEAPEAVADDSDDHPAVTVSPDFIHNFGVRTATVTRGPVPRRIEAVGRVSRMPQPRLVEVTPKLPGRLVALTDKEVGVSVEKGEPLFEVDSPEWRRLQRLYIDSHDEEGEEERAAKTVQRLQSLGMSENDLERLRESGAVEETLKIVAPQEGTIVAKEADVGDPVNSVSKVVVLGGVNRVPIIVSAFEGEGAWIDRGQRVTVRIPSMPGLEFEGQVDRTDREISFHNRTLPVYAGFRTAEPRIKYGMLVEVTIEAGGRNNVLRVPREALIRTGEGSRVIVARGDGRFQPVEVVAGLESGELVEAVSGLEEGQEVVVSGQFLIDSESSLRASFQRMDRTGNGSD